VVQTRDPSGAIEVGTDDDGSVLYDGPLLLLTSRFSASATEILAGALQDYQRAVVVGDTSTFGKGTVQSIVGLASVMDQAGLPHTYDPGALKVTISKFYRPSGASTQLRGVASDIVLPTPTDFSEVSEAALKNPLPWDVVPARSYEHLNRVQPYLVALREGSARRVKSQRDFAYLAGDVERMARNLATKSVSLNEIERRSELALAKARRDAFDRDSLAVQADRPVAYPITLKNVDIPGLSSPAPAKVQPPASADQSSPAGRPVSIGGDVILDESVRILSDYANLLGARKAATQLGELEAAPN
jgi:carboxyl-terminal processing protease